MREHICLLVVAGALGWTGLPKPVRAQQEDPAVHAIDLEDAEGRARFEAGRIAFIQRRYEDALADFRRAYELTGRAALLYNIGAAADRLREDAVALDAYSQFLQKVPDTDLRRDVEVRIAVLEQALAKASDAPPEPSGDGAGVPDEHDAIDEHDVIEDREPLESVLPPQVSQDHEATSGGLPLRTIGLATAGVGIVSLGASVYFGLRAIHLNDRSTGDAYCDAQNECTELGLARRNDAIRAATLGTVTLIAGGVLTAAGATLFVLGNSSAGIEATPVARPSEAGVLLRGWF